MREFAHAWFQGGLFGFSGVDGETSHEEPFVAAGTPDGIGWDFRLEPPVAVEAYLGEHRLVARNRSGDFCFPDCWRCSVHVAGQEGFVYGAFLNRASMAVAFEFYSLPETAAPRLVPNTQPQSVDGVELVCGAGWWLAICPELPGSITQIGVAVSYRNQEEAVQRARAARGADLPQAVSERLQFYETIPIPDSIYGELCRAFYKAAGIQKVNVESPQEYIPRRRTTPSRLPGRPRRSWDSALHALGLTYLRLDLAQDALRALLAEPRPDARIPLVSPPEGPADEERYAQPPLLAWAAWRQHQLIADAAFLQEIYPFLVQHVEWFEKNRKNDKGLYGWVLNTSDDAITGARGAESGMDNSPRFDQVTKTVAADLCGYMASEYLALERMADVLEKPGDLEEWQTRRQRIATLMNEHLWDDENRFYYDLDENGGVIPVKTIAGFIPMLGQIPDRDQAEALRLHLVDSHEFWSQFPVAGVAQDETTYSNDMWRGPTWPSMNILICHGLENYGFHDEARRLAHRTLEEIARWYLRTGCFFEYYDAQAWSPPPELPRRGAPGAKGGAGFGVIEDFNGTAVAYIHCAHLVH